jgi:hypothetical protein
MFTVSSLPCEETEMQFTPLASLVCLSNLRYILLTRGMDLFSGGGGQCLTGELQEGCRNTGEMGRCALMVIACLLCRRRVVGAHAAEAGPVDAAAAVGCH